jgi:hypothetical protein
MRVLLCLLGSLIVVSAYGQEKEKIIYQYKKYEKFDLGNLEVKGQLIAPGDISVRERERKRFELGLFERREFGEFIRKDIESLR